MPWAFERAATERGAPPRAAKGEARHEIRSGLSPLRPDRIFAPFTIGWDHLELLLLS
jgi:hypothetical protein